MPVMTADPLAVTDEQRAQLEQISRLRHPHRQVVQARALLWAAEGVPTTEVACRCDMTDTSVRRGGGASRPGGLPRWADRQGRGRRLRRRRHRG